MAHDGDHDGDRGLLDRLNALKPTVVNLDASSNSLDIPITPSAARSQPRNDTLSARLRTLRNRAQEGSGETPPGSPAPPAAAQPAVAQPPPCGARDPQGTTTPQPKPGPPRGPTTSPSPGPPAVVAGGGPGHGYEAEDDPLFLADGKDLDDFLDGLEDLDPLLDDDDGGEETAAGRQPSQLDDSLAEAKRVAALLETFQKDASLRPRGGLAGGAEGGGPGDEGADDEGGQQDDDDSERGEMSREVEDLLQQALDEAELDRQAGAGDDDDAHRQPPADQPGTEAASKDGEPAGPGRPPLAPSLLLPPPPSPPPPGQEGSRAQSRGGAEPTAPEPPADPFSLPTVPTALVDPVPSGRRRASLDFEADISSRMAALKGLGGSAAAATTDEFGMPSAPTFRPDDSRAAGKRRPGAAGRVGYTDEDQRTWCVVCLEDATVRCVGCGGDVYCEPCWRDMHVGPAAGYDERGHKRVKFEK